MPWYQKLIKYLSYIILGITFAGAILDGFSNAFDLITPKLAFWVSIILIGGLLIMSAILAFNPLKWRTGGGQIIRLKSLNKMITAPLLGIILLLWIPVIYKLAKAKDGIVPACTVEFLNNTLDTLIIRNSGSFGLHYFNPMGFYAYPPISGMTKLSCASNNCKESNSITLLPKETTEVKIELKNSTKYYHYFIDKEMLIGFGIQTLENQDYNSNIFHFDSDNYEYKFVWKIENENAEN